MATFTLTPIGVVRSARDEALDDDWDAVPASIEIDERFGPEALTGLDKFSHIEVVYVFDRVDPEQIELGSRRPRGNADWPLTGIFAQRAKMRPNRLGVSICRLVGIDGRTLTVEGLDAIDGSPVLDLKPHMAEFAARGEVRQPAWSHELMSSYWKR